MEEKSPKHMKEEDKFDTIIHNTTKSDKNEEQNKSNTDSLKDKVAKAYTTAFENYMRSKKDYDNKVEQDNRYNNLVNHYIPFNSNFDSNNDFSVETTTHIINISQNNKETCSDEDIYMNKKIELHKKLLDDIHSLYIKKNHDYGDSVHDTYEKYGLVSFLVRMEDKLNRVRTLTSKDDGMKVNDEKIEDTLQDLANYAILALLELKMKEK